MKKEILCLLTSITYKDSDPQQVEYQKNAFSVSDNKMYKKADESAYCILLFYLDSAHATISMEVKGYSKVFNDNNQEQVMETYLDEIVQPEMLELLLSKQAPIILTNPDYRQLENISNIPSPTSSAMKVFVKDIYKEYADFDLDDIESSSAFQCFIIRQIGSKGLEYALRYISL